MNFCESGIEACRLQRFDFHSDGIQHYTTVVMWLMEQKILTKRVEIRNPTVAKIYLPIFVNLMLLLLVHVFDVNFMQI